MYFNQGVWLYDYKKILYQTVIKKKYYWMEIYAITYMKYYSNFYNENRFI